MKLKKSRKTKKTVKRRTKKIKREIDPKMAEPYGGTNWYEMAEKYCCNFDIRQKEGKCITLHEPYYLFECSCNDCPLGIALMDKYVKEEVECTKI